VGVQDTDGRLKLIGFTARNDGLKRLADTRTQGVNPGNFALAAKSGIVLSACCNHEGKLAVISWDASSIKPVSPKPMIKRLDTFNGGAISIHQLDMAYLVTRDGFHRFAVFVRVPTRQAKIIIFDVDTKSGKIHRRHDFLGPKMSDVGSICEVDTNVVNENAPVKLAWAYANEVGAVTARLMFVERSGKIKSGGVATGGRGSNFQVREIDKNKFLLCYVQESDRRPMVLQVQMLDDGARLERLSHRVTQQRDKRRTTQIAVSTFSGSVHYLAMRDAGLQLRVIKIGVIGPEIEFVTNADANWEAIDPACEGNVGKVLAAARAAKDNANKLKLVLYRF
jgi:hypothetical protein